MAACSNKVRITEAISGLFENSPILKKDCFSDRIASTWHIWLMHKKFKIIVCQGISFLNAQPCSDNAIPAINIPTQIICKPRPSAKTVCCGGRGGLFIISFSAFSNDNEMAGKPSDTKFIQSICIGNNATGKPINGPSNNVNISLEFVVIRNLINLSMLW